MLNLHILFCNPVTHSTDHKDMPRACMHLIFNKKNVKYCIFSVLKMFLKKLEHKKLLWKYLTMNNPPLWWYIRATIYEKGFSTIIIITVCYNTLSCCLACQLKLKSKRSYTNKVTDFE